MSKTGHCGTCGSKLYENGTCPLCDRRRLAWWQVWDLDWLIEMARLDALVP